MLDCRYLVELVFGCSIVSGLRLLAASKVLGFCKLHRVIILYDSYSYIVIKLKQMFGIICIFKILKPIHIILGILLLLYALIDKVLFNDNKYYINFKNKLKWHK